MGKDYSLLRAFDLEAAKRGEAICWRADGEPPKYFNVTPAGNIIANFTAVTDGENLWGPHDFRMLPLAWVRVSKDDPTLRPIYPGDVLYWEPQPSAPLIAEKLMEGGWLAVRASEQEPLGIVHPDGLTWTKPVVMVKRSGFINICKVKHKMGSSGEVKDRIVRNADIFDDKDEAIKWANQCGDVIATVPIEWEEASGQEGGAK